MTVPAHPVFVKQLDGSRYAGLNCTCAAGAMALDRHTLGTDRTSGARVRSLTGDTSGGTTLPQVAAAIRSGWNVSLEVRLGISWAGFDAALRAGKGAILQGSSAATKGTKWQASETFAGNHAWFVNEGRGWAERNGVWSPAEYKVYDPLADGRRPAIAKSPMWIPAATVRKFAALLEVTPGNRLGTGRAYAAFTRDTEPHAHFRYGGTRTNPFPDRTRVTVSSGYMRSAPMLAAKYQIRPLRAGDLFIAYQITTRGEAWRGSRTWYGNHDGTQWIHALRLSHKGGST